MTRVTVWNEFLHEKEDDAVLTEEVLANTDVLIWWGHMGHDRVKNAY
ncbi:Undefined function [Listeria monocytogenes]|nr:Undefined function [Listeria monocytogenes]